MMRNRGSLMPVLTALVSWLKETTFSVGLYESWHFHYQTSVSLRPISAHVMGPNENNDELFFIITRALFTLIFLKKVKL